MIKIRKNVFETNSSSSHSLTLDSDALLDATFDIKYLRSGVFELYPGEYHWEWYRYYTLEEKLRYLFTQLCLSGSQSDYYYSNEDWFEQHSEGDALKKLYDLVLLRTGVKLEFKRGEALVDHQSVGNGLELFEDDEKLEKLLFCYESYIETGNDNENAPEQISSDSGTKEYFAHILAKEPSKSDLTRTFKAFDSEGVGLQNDERFKCDDFPGESFKLSDIIKWAQTSKAVIIQAKHKVESSKHELPSYIDTKYLRPNIYTLCKGDGLKTVRSLNVSATHKHVPDAKAWAKTVGITLVFSYRANLKGSQNHD